MSAAKVIPLNPDLPNKVRNRLIVRELTKDSDFKDESFEITDSYIPTNEQPLLTLHGHPICTVGNISLFISSPGTGKSNVAEAIDSSFINEDSDSFGFRATLEEGKKILHVDTERTKNDAFKGWQRIKNRAKMYMNDYRYQAMEGDKFKNVTFLTFMSIDKVEARKQTLEYYLKSGEYQLILIDGIGDFIKSYNKEEEAVEVVNWLIALCQKHQVGMWMTIHPKPGDKDFKPMGWIGSHLLRKAESVFVAFKTDENTRLITSDFYHGKVRNATDKLSTCYVWDDQERMFITYGSGEVIEQAQKVFKVSQDFYHHIQFLFSKQDKYSEDELIMHLKQMYTKAPDKVNHKTLQSCVTKLGWLKYTPPNPFFQESTGYYERQSEEKTDDCPF